MVFTSLLAIAGGFTLWAFVPDGPHRKPAAKIQLGAMFSVFKNKAFRSAAFGYFGHMWELYAFWAFVPFLLLLYNQLHPYIIFYVPLTSFIIIALGAFGCVIAGYLSSSSGTARIAGRALRASALCCIASPFFILQPFPNVFLGFLCFWGIVVIADSPLFSTLVAKHAPTDRKGTALTIVNSVGFAVTIGSILLVNQLQQASHPEYIYLVLGIGPVLGLLGLGRKLRRQEVTELHEKT